MSDIDLLVAAVHRLANAIESTIPRSGGGAGGPSYYRPIPGIGGGRGADLPFPGRREGHSALRVVGGQLELFDPHPNGEL